MNEDDLRAMIEGFAAKHNDNKGEGNYKDFLANYMHAMNQKATEDQLMQFGASVPTEQRRGMSEYMTSLGGGNYDRNPHTQEAHSGVANLLRALSSGR